MSPLTTSGLTKVIRPVRDLAAAKAVYGALLGVEPAMAEPTMAEPCYGGFDIGDQHLGLDRNGTPGHDPTGGVLAGRRHGERDSGAGPDRGRQAQRRRRHPIGLVQLPG
ncbi:MAG: glyoxalase/bleomycin resistance protein/dioxygenase [Marmoricola sp.]|nr:glyoxalase/bleomycin resistance protein/dioxygenase [Marmoricola sp.]